MNRIEAMIASGDYEGALPELDEAIAGSSDPSNLLLAVLARARMDDFDGAIERIRPLIEADPDLAGPMEELRLCAEAARTCVERRTDPGIAGKRAAVRPPPMFCLPYVKAAVMRAQGNHEEAKKALLEGRAEVRAVSGVLTRVSGESARFLNLVDSDDLTGPILPCFSDGSVLDVPYGDLLSLELLPPRISFDLIWAPAMIVMRDGGELSGRVPALYAGSGRHAEARVRTGQATLWDRSHGYAEGIGQRDLTLSLPDDGLSMLSVGISQVRRIDFDAPGGPEEGRKAFLERAGW